MAPAYHHLYLHGFASSPLSHKARETARLLAQHGIELDTPDLNLPNFEHLSLSAMVAEGERRLRAETVIWGSSLGGYLATVLAARHPDLVRKVILMAPAVNFPRDYPLRGAAARDAWASGRSVPVFHYALGHETPLAGDLLEDCRHWPSGISIACPGLVFAARNDDVIPLSSIESWAHAQPRVELIVLDDGHELRDTLPVLHAHALRFLGLA